MDKKQSGKSIKDASIEELKIAGFEAYQKKTQASQLISETNSMIQAINDELISREKKPLPTEEEPMVKEEKKK